MSCETCTDKQTIKLKKAKDDAIQWATKKGIARVAITIGKNGNYGFCSADDESLVRKTVVEYLSVG